MEFIVVLPPYSEDAACLFEKKSDREVNDEAFSSAFHRLFHIMSTWSPRETQRDGVHLSLEDIYSPSDPDEPNRISDRGNRHKYSYICLRKAGDLPLVPAISAFDIRPPRHPQQRRLAPKTGLELLARMPMVCWAAMELPDTEDRYPAIRRRNRGDLASVLRINSLPNSLDETLSLYLDSHPGANQTWHPANLLASDDQPDPVSSALWEASSKLNKLKQLIITGTIDPSLLWPAPLTTRASSIPHIDPLPFWQNITRLRINFDLRTPSGEWYFRAPDGIDIHEYPFLRQDPELELGTPVDRDVLETELPPGYDEADPDANVLAVELDWHSYVLNSGQAPLWTFRLVPEDRLLLPLIEAWARAVSQMPRVTTATLSTTLKLPVAEVGTGCRYGWYLRYFSPCQCSTCSTGIVREGEQKSHCSRLKTRALVFRTLAWRPNEALLELLKGIGSRYHGGGLEQRDDDDGSVVQELGLG